MMKKYQHTTRRLEVTIPGGNKLGIACEKTISTIGYIPPFPYLFNKGTTPHYSSPIPTKKKTESFFVGIGEE